jgi:hypothetical protein
MFKSTLPMVALAAITLSFLATIQSAEARRYRSYCGYPEYGYLAPYPLGGNHTPRVSFVPVVVYCTDHPYVVWRHCNINSAGELGVTRTGRNKRVSFWPQTDVSG